LNNRKFFEDVNYLKGSKVLCGCEIFRKIEESFRMEFILKNRKFFENLSCFEE